MKFVLFVTLIWSILDSGWSITDEDLVRIEAGLSQIQVLTREMAEVKAENNQMRTQNNQLRERVARLEEICGTDSDKDLVQNATIEERVTFLEVQMTEVQEEVIGLQDQVGELEDEFVILFDQQIIQDERIFILEQETADLDTRVEVLEANGGGGGNVTGLEERVETLEATAAEHEADIADLESATSNIDGRVETLEGETSELETRLTAAETQIEDLQATDVELDSRISDLEEGGGGATNATIAFYAAMSVTDDDNIPTGSTMIFSDVVVNEGDGYNPATGIFTVPSGGEGFYYFATYFTVYRHEAVFIDMRVTNVPVCFLVEDTQEAADPDNVGCSVTVFLQEGDEVKNVYSSGTDSTPVWGNGYSGFTGFRI